jgi:hypothetical protein
MGRRPTWASICLILVLVSTAAWAEPITVRVRGRVVDNLPAPYAVFNGGRFEIVYTFESETPDANPGDPGSGLYSNSYVSGYMTVNSGPSHVRWELDTAALSDITVQYTSTAHAYFAGAYLVPKPSGLTPQYFIVQLVDRDLKAFASDALPTTLELSQFEWLHSVQLTFDGTCCTTFGEITQLRVKN